MISSSPLARLAALGVLRTYILDPGIFSTRLADGNFAIIKTFPSLSLAGEATIAFTGPNTLTYTVPLSAIGGGSGAVQIAVAAFNGAGTFGSPVSTDCAPNAAYIST